MTQAGVCLLRADRWYAASSSTRDAVPRAPVTTPAGHFAIENWSSRRMNQSTRRPSFATSGNGLRYGLD
jgi:hypothetical protein